MSSAVRRICKNKNLAAKVLGTKNAQFLHERLADIDAAQNGFELKLLPGIFLLNDQTGEVMSLLGTIIVLSATQGHLAEPRSSLGSIDWGEVVRLKVLEVGGKQ